MSTRKLQALKVMFLWQLFISFLLCGIVIDMLATLRQRITCGTVIIALICVAGSFGLTYSFYSGSKAYKLSRRELIVVILTLALVTTAGAFFLLSD